MKELSRGTAVPLVLRVLSESPQHGYGILLAIKERSGGRLEFTEGTIYPLLHTLEGEGLVQAEWQTLENGRRRKLYQITPLGLERLERVAGEWAEFRTAMDAFFSPGRGGARHA